MFQATFNESLKLLATRRFGTFWFASLLSNIGTWAQQVAQPWVMLSLGASPFLLGVDNFALTAPVFALTLLGGALADARDRRRTILRFQTLQMCCPIAIVLLLWQHQLQPWMVIGLSLVVGVTDGLSMPSFQSIVPSIVEKAQIPTGLALNSTQFNLSRIMGPAVAGALMASVGAMGAFGVSALSYVPFILVAWWILPRVASGAVAPHAQLNWPQIFGNVGEVLGPPAIRGALVTVFTSGLLCAPLIVFCPVLVRASLHGDVSHFSISVGAFGVGGLVGALVLLGLDAQSQRARICAGFAVALGLAVVLASQSRSAWMLPVLFAAAGLCMTMSNTAANTLLQSTAQPRLRGQTVSVFMLMMRGGIALGGLLTGITISWLGVRDALLLNGLVAVGLQVLVASFWLTKAVDAQIP